MSNNYVTSFFHKGVNANCLLPEIVGYDKASDTSGKLAIVEATIMPVQVITYIINKICFDVIACFAVTVGNISILNCIYDLGFELHAMGRIFKVLKLIKSPKCVLCITNKILFIVLIIMIFTLISLLILILSDGIDFFVFKTHGIGLVCSYFATIDVELSLFAALVVMSQDSHNIFNDKWIVIEYVIVNKKNSVNFFYDKVRRIYLNEFNNGKIFLFPNCQYSISFGNFNDSKAWLVLFVKSQEKQENIFNEFGENEMFSVYEIKDDINIYSNNKNTSEKYSSNKNSNDKKQIGCELSFENAFIELNNLRNVNCNCNTVIIFNTKKLEIKDDKDMKMLSIHLRISFYQPFC